MSLRNTIKSADIDVGEFAQLAGVSRVATHRWLKGSQINPLREPKIKKLEAAITSAVKAKDLPLDKINRRDPEAKDARMVKIKTIVVKHLRAAGK